MRSSNSRKLLIVGATGFERNKEGLRVDCISWPDIITLNNIRDYDTLIINLLESDLEIAKIKDWGHFHRLFNFRAAFDILKPNGKIVIIGNPDFGIYHPELLRNIPFLEWTGLVINWDKGSGDTKEIPHPINPEYSEFLKSLRKWHYSSAGFSLTKAAASRSVDFGESYAQAAPSIKVNPIAINRYGRQLVFEIRHCWFKGQFSLSECGPICFLPRIDLDPAATLQLVLRDICDAATDLPEPSWVANYQTPGQSVIDQRILSIQVVLKDATLQMENARHDRIKVRTPLKLLYEREFALEPAVREIFQSLGADIEMPVETNKEDGWLTVRVGRTVYEGVLEIKSTKSDQFAEDGRKQLLDWIDRGITLRQKIYKGIFVGNSAVSKPPADRQDPFSSSFRLSAQLSKMCVMTSADLYEIYLLQQTGKLDSDMFWKRLFETEGVFDISAFIAPRAQSNSPNLGENH